MTIDDLENEPRFAEWYTSHKVFDRLFAIQNFYDSIYNTSLGFCEAPYTIRNISTQNVLFPSIRGTIESISLLLKNGHINDAFALIRKYSDVIVIDTYNSIIIKEGNEQFLNGGSCENLANNKVSKWIKSKSPLMEEHPKREFQKIAKTFPKLIEILNLNPKDENSIYKKIRDLSNDNMHYNSFCVLFWNDPDYLKHNRDIALKLLNNAYSYMTFLSSMHFAFIYESHPHYFMACDYVLSLEMEEQPPSGSQYWIAASLQDFFTNVVYSYNKNLGEYLISLNLMDLNNGTEQDK